MKQTCEIAKCLSVCLCDPTSAAAAMSTNLTYGNNNIANGSQMFLSKDFPNLLILKFVYVMPSNCTSYTTQYNKNTSCSSLC